jgi:hypothetical protein
MLLGNYSIFNKNPIRFSAGTLAESFTKGPTKGQKRNFYAGEATVVSGASIADKNSFPNGYVIPYAWMQSPKAGGLATYNTIDGTGTVTNGNLAGGLNGDADLTGSGDITNAELALIVSAVAALTGAGALTGDILGKLEAAANLTGAGAITTANLGALADLVAALTGTGTASADIVAKAFMSADITVTGDILSTANIAEYVWNGVAEGSLTYQHAIRLLLAVAVGKTDIATGPTIVTFRDTEDSVDRVVAEMSGSERTNITLDPN